MRYRRLLELVRQLRSGQGHTVGTLADTLGVSRRTIFRDIALLRDWGMLLEFDRQRQRFRVRGGRRLP